MPNGCKAWFLIGCVSRFPLLITNSLSYKSKDMFFLIGEERGFELRILLILKREVLIDQEGVDKNVFVLP